MTSGGLGAPFGVGLFFAEVAGFALLATLGAGIGTPSHARAGDGRAPDLLRLIQVLIHEKTVAMSDRDAVVSRFRQVAAFMEDFAQWAKKQSDAILDELVRRG